jgi:hypothetical protein
MTALEHLQQRLQDTNASIVQAENALTLPENKEQVRSLSAAIKALHNMRQRLEEQFLELAAIQEQEVYRYRITETDERPSLGGIADAWSKFENLFAVVYSKLANKEMPSPLGYSYCFTGSVGVVVTLPKLPAQQAGMMAGNPITETSDIVFDLIESKRVTEIAKDLGPEPIAALNEWLAVHLAHHFGLGLEWKSERVTKRAIEVPYDQLPVLQNVILEAATETTLITNGELQGVDIVDKTFKFKADDGETIEGTFEDAVTAQHEASVPRRYIATIIKTTKLLPKTKKEKEKPVTYFLKSLENL